MTRAQPIDMGLTATDSAIPLGNAFFLGMATLFDVSRSATPIVSTIGNLQLASFCRERQNSTAESAFPALFGGKFCLPVGGAMSLI